MHIGLVKLLLDAKWYTVTASALKPRRATKHWHNRLFDSNKMMMRAFRNFFFHINLRLYWVTSLGW